MTPKSQRLTLALLALAAIVAAVLLAMSAMKDQAAFFYTPSDAKAQGCRWARRCGWEAWSRRDRSTVRPTA